MQINKIKKNEEIFETFYLVKFSKAELLALRAIAENYITYMGFKNLKDIARDFTKNIPEDLHEDVHFCDYIGKVFQ